MLPHELTKDVTTRLRSIKGQIEGLITMIESDREPQQILTQFKAATNALETAQTLLLDEVFRKALAIKIVEALEACPGNCGQEEKIEMMRREFPNLTLGELTGKMKDVESLQILISKKQ